MRGLNKKTGSEDTFGRTKSDCVARVIDQERIRKKLWKTVHFQAEWKGSIKRMRMLQEEEGMAEHLSQWLGKISRLKQNKIQIKRMAIHQM